MRHLFPWWLPEELHKPPPELKGKKRRKWFDRRAIYRYSIDEIDTETGDIRFWCPQCAGRIRSNLKTRNSKVKPNKKAPFITRTDEAEYCCPGRVTIPVEYSTATIRSSMAPQPTRSPITAATRSKT